MLDRNATINVRVNEHMTDYIDFLREYHSGIEELVERDLKQPFNSAYHAYVRYRREGLEEKYPLITILLSKSPVIQRAIELRREHAGEPDEYVLKRIMYEFFDLEQPKAGGAA